MHRPSLRLTALAVATSVSLLTGCGGEDKTKTEAESKPAATQSAQQKTDVEDKQDEARGLKTKVRKTVESIEKPKNLPATLPVGEDADLQVPITMEALKKADIESEDEDGVEVAVNVRRLLSAAPGESKEDFAQRVVEQLGKPDGAWVMIFYPGTKNEVEAVQAHWKTDDGGLLMLYGSKFLREDGSDPDVIPARVTYLDPTVAKGWQSGDKKLDGGVHYPTNKPWKPLELK